MNDFCHHFIRDMPYMPCSGNRYKPILKKGPLKLWLIHKEIIISPNSICTNSSIIQSSTFIVVPNKIKTKFYLCTAQPLLIFYSFSFQVDEDLMCQICLQPFVSPTDTPCSHTFCQVRFLYGFGLMHLPI